MTIRLGNPVLSAAVIGVLFSCALHAQPHEPIREIGTPIIHAGAETGTTTLDHQRSALLYVDTFDRYPTSDEPIFDRFQVSMHGRGNGTGGTWTAFDREYITTLFVDGQLDLSGKPDPMPRWQGADLVDNTGGTVLGDITGDFQVDTTDLGILIGSFGRIGTGVKTDLNGDGVVDTADLGIMISAFGQGFGPFCLYQVSGVFEQEPGGAILPQPVLDAGPVIGDVIAVPTSLGACGACTHYRFLGQDQDEAVYGTWTLLDDDAPAIGPADFLADLISQSCGGWGDNPVLALARTESELNIPACCFYSLFSPLGQQTTASALTDIVTQIDLFLTGHQTFLWFQAFDNNLRASWDVMLGGMPLYLDTNLLPFADGAGELACFIVRQSSHVPGAGQGLFYGTVADAATGAVGKEALLGEWFKMRMVQHANSTFELWVRDSETLLLDNTQPGSNSDGVSDDGYARLVPSGPYGPAIWNMQPGVSAPNPFLVATPSLRQLQWLWGGDPPQAAVPDYMPANWFMDNIRITGPF